MASWVGVSGELQESTFGSKGDDVTDNSVKVRVFTKAGEQSATAAVTEILGTIEGIACSMLSKGSQQLAVNLSTSLVQTFNLVTVYPHVWLSLTMPVAVYYGHSRWAPFVRDHYGLSGDPGDVKRLEEQSYAFQTVSFLHYVIGYATNEPKYAYLLTSVVCLALIMFIWRFEPVTGSPSEVNVGGALLTVFLTSKFLNYATSHGGQRERVTNPTCFYTFQQVARDTFQHLSVLSIATGSYVIGQALRPFNSERMKVQVIRNFSWTTTSVVNMAMGINARCHVIVFAVKKGVINGIEQFDWQIVPLTIKGFRVLPQKPVFGCQSGWIDLRDRSAFSKHQVLERLNQLWCDKGCRWLSLMVVTLDAPCHIFTPDLIGDVDLSCIETFWSFLTSDDGRARVTSLHVPTVIDGGEWTDLTGASREVLSESCNTSEMFRSRQAAQLDGVTNLYYNEAWRSYRQRLNVIAGRPMAEVIDLGDASDDETFTEMFARLAPAGAGIRPGDVAPLVEAAPVEGAGAPVE